MSKSATKKTRTRTPTAKARTARRAHTPPPPMTAPRVTVGTALCHAGLDELALGERWVAILHNLCKDEHQKNATSQKLLFDVLKECTRQLDNDHEQAAAGANVVVRLVHAVPRPPRVIAALATPNPAVTETISTNEPQQQEPS